MPKSKDVGVWSDVDRLDCCVKDMGGGENDRRVIGRVDIPKVSGTPEEERLGRGFFVGDVGVTYGEET